MRSVLTRAALPFGVLFVSLLSTAAHAETQSVSEASKTRTIRLGGVYAGPNTTDLEARSRAILGAQNKTTPSFAGAGLVKSGVDRFGDGEAIVRFAQTHRGLPVIGRGASVRLKQNGQPAVTVVDLATDLPVADAAISPERAAAIASSRMIVRATASDSHLVVWPTFDGGARLAYVVLPRVPTGIASQPRAIVDAATGEILQLRDMVHFAKPMAKMYEFNPTKTPTLADRELTLTPGATLTNEFLTSTNCIDKKSVRAVDMYGFNLSVHVCDLEQRATANEAGNFEYDPSDEAGADASRSDPFSEVSIFYHASKAYTFFRTLQGDSTAQVVSDKPLRLIANLQMPAGMMSGNIAQASNPDIPLETFQNAFFSPASGGLGSLFQSLYGFDSGALWFGQGPKRDYSYDGDVVYHEFTHAVVDETLKLEAWHVDAFGAVDSPGAMNEGLADYFSSAITGDPNVGEYAAADLGDGTVIRSLDNQDKCPTAVAGEVHFDSTLFSGGLWEARQSLPEGDRNKFDGALYKAMRSNAGRGDLGYDDLVELFSATLKQDLPSGATALDTAMTNRGVLPSCNRVLDYDGKTLSSPYKRYGFAAPGTQSVNVKGTAPGIVQIRAQLPMYATSVKVSFSAKAAGGAQSVLGGGAKFEPVVLANLDKAITWDKKSKAGHDAALKAEASDGDGAMDATLTIPEGTTAKEIYVQIANNGGADGSYDDIELTFTTATPPDVPATDGTDTTAGSKPTTTSGCSAGPVGGNASMLSGIGFALAALIGASRRRSRRG